MQTIEKKAPDLFARHGLDDDSFINKYLLPALNAKETRVFNADGQIIYSKPLVAWGPRVEMNKLVARMKGMIREDNAPQTSVKVVVINAEHRPPREVSVEAVSST